jgi:hypothetical protein
MITGAVLMYAGALRKLRGVGGPDARDARGAGRSRVETRARRVPRRVLKDAPSERPSGHVAAAPSPGFSPGIETARPSSPSTMVCPPRTSTGGTASRVEIRGASNCTSRGESPRSAWGAP